MDAFQAIENLYSMHLAKLDSVILQLRIIIFILGILAGLKLVKY
jgi:hypothetical protein|tara:strand:+ start:2135 stop:2266 length:132 start_codon:yes stop_codon:yes gene_type:complete